MKTEPKSFEHDGPLQAPHRDHVTAVVRADGTDTLYRRSGAGAPVLLLRTSSGDECDPVFAALAACFLVISPSPRPAGERNEAQVSSEWLAGLVEGLGLDRPHIVVDHDHAGIALRHAFARPDAAGWVAVIPADPAAPSPQDLSALVSLLGIPR